MLLDALFSWANVRDESLELMRFTQTVNGLPMVQTTPTLLTPARDRMFIIMSYAVHSTPELGLFANYAELLIVDEVGTEHLLWGTQPHRGSSGAGPGVEPATAFGGAAWPLIVPPGFGLRSRAGFSGTGGGAGHRSVHFIQGIRAPRGTLL